MHPGLAELLNDARIPRGTAASGNAGQDAQSLDGGYVGALQRATDQTQQLGQVTKQYRDSVNSNNEVLKQSVSVQASSQGGGTLSNIGQGAGGLLQGSSLGGILGGSSSGGFFGGILGSLFGAVPLLSSLAGLFGGGPSQPIPLTQYEAPASQAFSASLSMGHIGDAVYGSTGQPRQSSITELALQGLQSAQPSGSMSSGGSQTANSSQSGAPQIAVHVQAMDSQSFMDRAGDIANAVRSAMLNMHSINDVINDL